MPAIYTDAASETGVTVGLVDSITNICAVLKTRDLSSPEVVEALRSVATDAGAIHFVDAVRRSDAFGQF